jgi:ElaB/YqjD/DUF883 family membrane-anchored ribosome-binding protein
MTVQTRAGPNDPAAIRHEILRTRERLEDTVEALGTQLNPSHIARRVSDRAREATIGRVKHMANETTDRIAGTGRDIAQLVRDNPVPAALAALGIGWLLFNRNDGRDRQRDRERIPRDATDGRDVGLGDDAFERTRELAEDVSDRATALADTARDKAQETADRARETADRVADAAERAANRARNAADRGRRRVAEEYDENPLASAVLALGVGLAIGVALPSTRKEGEMMGRARDRVVDKARTQVADTAERVENAIDRARPEVTAAIREAARDEGLTGPDTT